MSRGRVARAVFPPEEVAQVKAIACELPASHGLPVSRFSRSELHRLVIERGVTDASAATIWRWLAEDAIKPWQYRSWVFPRDPNFAERAGPALDLYERRWEGKLLEPGEFVICTDEKTQIQARRRIPATTPPQPGRPMRVEHEYERGGALAYIAAWDVHRGRLIGRCEATTGIVPFGRLVEQVMTKEPYASAKRVFWILDNGSSHAGKTSIDRLPGPMGVSSGGCETLMVDAPRNARSSTGRGLGPRPRPHNGGRRPCRTVCVGSGWTFTRTRAPWRCSMTSPGR